MSLETDRIILDVAHERGISVGNLLGNRRKRHFIAARKEAIGRIKYKTNLTITAISKIFGYSDHTTVSHHLNNYIEGE